MTYHIAPLELDDITDYHTYLRSNRSFIEAYNTKQPRLFYTHPYQVIRYLTGCVTGESRYHYLIRDAKNQHVIGYIRLYHVKRIKHENKRTGVLAFALHPDYTGRGIMNKILEPFLQTVKTKYPIDRIEATVHMDNHACIKTLTRYGFTEYPYTASHVPNGIHLLKCLHFEYEFKSS